MAGTVHPILSVLPARGLMDEKFCVLVENLSPGLPVTLHSRHRTENNLHWQAYGHYVSDNRGTVNVSSDSSHGGTYTGKEPMGLLWSMQQEEKDIIFITKKNVQTPMVIHISVYRGHVDKGFRDSPPMASVVVERWYMAPGVKRVEVRERGISGTLFIPPGPGPFPGLLDLWGGVEMLLESRAALFASHGFVSLALNYYAPKIMKPKDVDVNFLETAFQIIQEHPLVIEDRVGVFGSSLGGSFALTIASHSEIVSPRCCVSVNGTHVYSFTKTLDGVLEDMTRNRSKLQQVGEGLKYRDMFLPISANPKDKVDVGRIKCPLLLICGDDDQSFESVASAEDMAKMMRKAGNDHLLTTIIYPNAGHIIDSAYHTHIRVSSFNPTDGSGQKSQTVNVVWGGHPKPHADAQEDSWEKILAFLKQHLYPSPHTVLQAKM